MRSIASFAEGASSLSSVSLGAAGALSSVGSASRAFAGCPALHEVTLSGLTAAGVDAREMLAGAGTSAPGGTCSVTGSFEGEGFECTRMMAGAAFGNVEIAFGRASGGVAGAADEALFGMESLERAEVTAYDGCAVSAERLLAGSGSDAGCALVLAGFAGGASVEEMCAGAFSGAGGSQIEWRASGSGARVAPSTMAGMFKGCGNVGAADLSGMPAAPSDVSGMFEGVGGMGSVVMGGAGLEAGVLRLPEGWDLSGVSDASRMWAESGFRSVEIAGLSDGSGVDLTGAFAGAERLERVALTGSPKGYAASLRGAFAGCERLASVDLTGLSTSGMGGSQASYGELSAMSGMWADSSAVTGAAVTITVPATFSKLLNGFFGEVPRAGAEPTYVLGANVRVDVTTGPETASALMPCPTGFAARIYLMDEVAATRQTAVWVRQGYGSSLAYDSESVIRATGSRTGVAWGEQVLGYGFVGEVSAADPNGTQVAWALRSTDGTPENTVLCIYPGPGRSEANPGVMRSFTVEVADAAPWSAKAVGAADGVMGVGFSGAFAKAKVYPGVVAGPLIASMFEGCSAMETCDMTNMTVYKSTWNMGRMFAGCAALTSVQTVGAEAHSAGIDDGAVGTGQMYGTGLSWRTAHTDQPGFWNTNEARVNVPADTDGFQFYASYMFSHLRSAKSFDVRDSFNAPKMDAYHMSTTGVGSYSGMGNLERAVLINFGNGEGSRLEYILGEAANDASLKGKSPTLTVDNVGNGRKTNFTHAFANMQRLKTATISNSGANANMLYFFNQDFALTSVTMTNVGHGPYASLNRAFHMVGSNGNNTDNWPQTPANTPDFIQLGETARMNFTNVGTNANDYTHMFWNTFGTELLDKAEIYWNSSYDVNAKGNAYAIFYNSGFTRMDVQDMPKLGQGDSSKTDFAYEVRSDTDFKNCFARMQRIKKIVNSAEGADWQLSLKPSTITDQMIRAAGIPWRWENDAGFCNMMCTAEWRSKTWDLDAMGDTGGMFSQCTSLEEISITGAWGMNPAIPFRRMPQWAQDNPSLKSFYMGGPGVNFNYSGMGNIVANCPKLEYFGIIDCTSYTIQQADYAFLNCANLTMVDLTGVYGTWYWSEQVGNFLFAGASSIIQSRDHYGDALTGEQRSDSGKDATIRIGEGWYWIPNGFFWSQATVGAEPDYFLGVNTKVELVPKQLVGYADWTTFAGPQTPSNLQDCNPIVPGKTYHYPGGDDQIVFVDWNSWEFKDDPNNVRSPQWLKENVWKKKGYFGGQTPQAQTWDIGLDGNNIVKAALGLDGVMHIYGAADAAGAVGADNKTMKNFGSASDVPWYGNTLVREVYVDNTVNAYQYLNYLFASLPNLVKCDLRNLRTTTNLQQVNSMFRDSGRLPAIGHYDRDGRAKLWDPDLGTEGGYYMSNDPAWNFNNLGGVAFSNDASHLVTTSVTNGEYFAANCASLERASIHGWATGTMETSWHFTFQGSTRLTHVNITDIGNNVQHGWVLYGRFFKGCTSLSDVVLGRMGNAVWDGTGTKSRVYAVEMFADCTGLRNLHLKNVFNGSNPRFGYAFVRCYNLENVAFTNCFNGSCVYEGANSSERGYNYGALFALSFTNRDHYSSITFEHCFNGSGSVTRQALNECYGLRKLVMRDCGNGDSPLMDGFTYHALMLTDVELDNVGNGRNASLYRFFLGTMNKRSGVGGYDFDGPVKATWTINDMGKNNSNLRNFMQSCFLDQEYTDDSSLTWTYTGSRGTTQSLGAAFGAPYYNATNMLWGDDVKDVGAPYGFDNGVYIDDASSIAMPRYDLRGLPSLTAAGASPADGSMWRMFQSLTKIEHVKSLAHGAAAPEGKYLLLDPNWTTVNNQNMYGMFVNCTSLKTVELVDLYKAPHMNAQANFWGTPKLESFSCVSTQEYAYSVNLLDYFYANTSLKKASFLGPGTIAPVTLETLFNGCGQLEEVDFTGISTECLPHTAYDPNDITTAMQNNGMNGLFRGCPKMTSVPAAGETRGKLTLGPKFDLALNGLIEYRTSITTVEYTLQADLTVNGGPATTDYILECPADYTGNVNLVGDNAAERVHLWIERHYYNYSVNGSKRLDTDYGIMIAQGFIGHDGAYDFSPVLSAGPAGTSHEADVMWSIRTGADGVNTLLVFPADSDSKFGVMREFSVGNEQTVAPWGRFSAYADQFERVAFLGNVYAVGSLQAMFDGCTTLANVDLQQLVITPATTDASYLFRNCTAVTKVAPSTAATLPPAPDALPSDGVRLGALDPADARYLLSGCTGLEDLTLTGFATGGSANLEHMLTGAGAEGAAFKLSGIAANAVGADLSHMMDGCLAESVDMSGSALAADVNVSYLLANSLRLKTVTLSGMANMPGVDLSYMLAEDALLESVTMTNVGSGENANLTSMFAGCSTFVDASTAAVRMSDVSPDDEGILSYNEETGSFQRYATAEDIAAMTAVGTTGGEVSGAAASASEGQKDSSTAALRASAQNDTDEAAPQADVRVTYALTDVGTGSGAKLTDLLAGAFSSPAISADSSFSLLRTGAQANAGDLTGAFDAGEAGASYMPSYDLRGLSHAPTASKLTAMFRNLKAVGWVTEAALADAKAVPGMPVSDKPSEAAGDVALQGGGIALPDGWDTSTVTDYGSMFSGCEGLTTAYLKGLNHRGIRPTMDSMFEGCGKLRYAALAAPGATGAAPDYSKVGSILSAKRMFAECAALAHVDLRGIGTGYLNVTGSLTEGVTGMQSMFEGSGLATTGETGASTGRIVLGEESTRVGNGFFGQTEVADEDGNVLVPRYTLTADVYVFGGPQAASELMIRPGDNGADKEDAADAYKAMVFLMDSSALKVRNSVWAVDRYVNITNSSGVSEEIRDAGLIGLGSTEDEVRWDGMDWDGRSVEWVLEGSVDDIQAGQGTLVIQPAAGFERAVMRPFDATNGAAPWRAGTELSGMFDRVVVRTHQESAGSPVVAVEAHESLAAMFSNLERVKSVDLTALVVDEKSALADATAMFFGMASVKGVFAGALPSGADADAILLPADMVTSHVVRASSMFAGMTSLESVDLTGLSRPAFSADGADLTSMFEGSFSTDAGAAPTLSLSGFGNGAGADMTRFAARGQTSDGPIGGGLASVVMADSASGADAKLTAAFRENARLKTAAFTGVGSGRGADLTWMLEGCGTAFTSDDTVTWSFTDAGTGGGADFSHLAVGALTNPVADGSKIEFLLSTGTAPAVPVSVEGMLSAGQDYSSESTVNSALHMPTVDLRGFAGIDGSAAQWMCGLSGPTELVQDDDAADAGKVTLREGFSFEKTTSLNAAFAEMGTLERAALSGVCAGAGAEIDLSHAFAHDGKLGSVALTGAAQGSATDMTGMFEGDAELASVDLTGVGTSAIQGSVDAAGIAPTGMRNLFAGCSKIAAAPGAGFDDAAHEGRVTIGAGFTRVLNGFFADREDGDSAPSYILTANVSVFGGPQAATDLMVRPEFTSAGVTSIYSGTVSLADAAAQAARGTWLERRYLNISLGGNDPIDPGVGRLVDWGLIGVHGEYETPAGEVLQGDGGSVAWSVHEKDGAYTLYLFPTDGEWGKMRPFGTGAAAPWTREAGRMVEEGMLSDLIERVEVSPGVAAGTSLSEAFEHLVSAEVIDLRNLQVDTDMASLQAAFEGCASLAHVLTAAADEDVTATPGLWLPPVMAAPENLAQDPGQGYLDTTGVASAFRAFAGCAGLESVTLTGTDACPLFSRAGANLSQMFSGAMQAPRVTDGAVTLANLGNGRGADLSSMLGSAGAEAAPSGMRTLFLSNVGNGDVADLAHLADGAAGLMSAGIQNVGNGASAQLSHAFANVATKGTGVPAGAQGLSFTLEDTGVGGTAATAGADLSDLFAGSFTEPALSGLPEGAKVVFKGSSDASAAPAATSVARLLYPGPDAESHLTHADLRGLPAVAGGASRSAELMLANLAEIRVVTDKCDREGALPSAAAYLGEASSDAAGHALVALPWHWDTAAVTSMAGMCQRMGTLALFDTTDLVTSRAGTDLSSMFDGCGSLRWAVFDAGATEPARFDADGKRVITEGRNVDVEPGYASSMVGMFKGCTVLDHVDFYGLGTLDLGTSTEGEAAVTRQDGMFEECWAMVKDPTDPSVEDAMNAEPGSATTAEQRGTGGSDGVRSSRPEIVIGPAFTDVVNGLVWQRFSTSASPAYILMANIDVYGGPQTADTLMTRPSASDGDPAWSYNAYVNLADEDAFMARSVWAKREYLNMKMMGELVTEDVPDSVTLAGGYIGLEGRYAGAIWDGTSVKWEVLQKRDDASDVLLRISPDAGTSGVMRAFGAQTGTAAPWSALGERADLAERISRVEVAGQITCSGNLTSMFQGLANAHSMDLTGLSFVAEDPAASNKNPAIGVVSVAEMLAGCSKIEAVRTMAAASEVPAGTCALPAGGDTSALKSARGMLSDMAALTTVDIAGLGEGASGASFAGFAAGSLIEPGSSLKLTDVATGEAASLAGAFKGCAGLKTVELTRVGGARLDATSAFEGCAALTDATVASFGAARSDLTRAFAGCATDLRGQKTVTYRFTDTAVTGGCVLDGAFANAFTTEDVAADSCVSFTARSSSGAVASAVSVFEPDDAAADPCMMPKMDFSGFGGVSVQVGSSGSAARMFAGNAAVTQVTTDASATSGIIFPRAANWANTTSAAYMFAGCEKLERAEVTDLCKNRLGVNLYGLFEGCTALTSATLSSSTPVASSTLSEASAAQARIGTANNLVRAFAGCEKLTDVDLAGVGTYGLPGTIDGYGTANDPESGMSQMFVGCTALTYVNDASDARCELMQAMEAAKAKDDPDLLDQARRDFEAADYELGRVTIGPAFTKVMNGFFAWRNIADKRPVYLLAADVCVYGGPTAVGGASASEASALMARPSVGGYNYFGEVLLADGAALARNDAVTLGGVKGLWTIQGYFESPLQAVSMTFETDWAGPDGEPIQAAPASQSRAFKSAKYKAKEEGGVEQTRRGDALSREGVAAPAGLGYAAADAKGDVAATAEDVAWYMGGFESAKAAEAAGFTDNGDGTYTWASADPAVPSFTYRTGQRAVDQAEYDAASPAERADLCVLFGLDAFGSMPLFDADGNPVLAGKTQVMGPAPAFTLFCEKAEIAYEVVFADASRDLSVSGGTLAFESGTMALPAPENVMGEDWTRPGHVFLGWTIGATASADWTDKTYLRANAEEGVFDKVGAGAGSATAGLPGAYPNGALSGYASVPAVLYAQWAEIPEVSFRVNNSTTWKSVWGTPLPDEDLSADGTSGVMTFTFAEGDEGTYQVQGTEADPLLHGASGGTSAFFGYNGGALVDDEQGAHVGEAAHGAVAGVPVWENGRVRTFSVVVPSVFKENAATQSDTSWCTDVNCTSQPSGLLMQSRTWETKTSVDLYRRIGEAVLTIDFAPGDEFASVSNAYSRTFSAGKDYTLPGVAFRFNGHAFKEWKGAWARPGAPGGDYWYKTVDADGVEQTVPLRWQDIRPGAAVRLPDGARLSSDAVLALFPERASDDGAVQLDHARLTATWEKVWYTVTCYLNDGTDASSTFSYQISDLDITVPEVGRQGYAFAGWTGGAVPRDEGRWAIAAGTFGDLVLQALWTPETYDIAYVLKGDYQDALTNPSWGVDQGAGGYSTGERVEIPEPVWEGFAFRGWQAAGEAGPTKPYAIEAGRFGNVTLTARWEAVAHEITYDLKGGAWTDPDEVPTSYATSDTADTVLPAPVRKGYEFTGWTGGSVGTVPQTEARIPAGSVGAMAFTANWRPITYAIAWDLNGGDAGAWTLDGVDQTGPLPVTYTAEQTIQVAPPHRSSSSFLGWGGTLAAIGAGPDLVTGDLTIKAGTTGGLSFKANWAFSEYHVRFDAGSFTDADGTRDGEKISDAADTPAHFSILENGYDGIEQVSAQVELPKEAWGLSLEHAELLGWGLKEGGDVIWAPGARPTMGQIIAQEGAVLSANAEITLYAIWGTTSRAIIYHTIDDVEATGAPAAYWKGEGLAHDVLYAESALPKKAGYAFAGWYETPDYTGAKVESIGADATGEVELFARWTYQVRYDASGAERLLDADGKPDASVSFLPFDDADPQNTETLTWYACGKYLDAAYLGASYGPDVEAAIKAQADQVKAAGAGPASGGSWTAKGYTFEGDWTTSASVLPGSVAAEASQIAAGAAVNGMLQPDASTATVTLYAQWTPITYPVELIYPADGAGAITPAVADLGWTDEAGAPTARTIVSYGRGWTTPATVPAWEEHGFMGWALVEFGEDQTPQIVVDEAGEPVHLIGANTRVTVDFADRAESTGAVFMALFRQTSHMALNLDANGGSLRTDVGSDERFPVSFILEDDDSTGVRLPGADAFAAGAVTGEGDAAIEKPSYGVPPSAKVQPFWREGYILSGWKWEGADGGELEATLSWNADGAREGAGTWVVELPLLTEVASLGKTSVTAVAQWEPVPYRVAFMDTDADGEDVDTGKFQDDLSYASPSFKMLLQGDLEHDGMTLISWAVSKAAQAASWAPDERVSLLDVLAAAKAAGAGIAAGNGAGAGTTGYVIWDVKAKTEVSEEGPDTVRLVRLYARWTGQILVDVPTYLALAFDKEANQNKGGFLPGEAEIRTTGRRDLSVASVRTEWNDGSDGLLSLYPRSTWTRFGDTVFAITDLARRSEVTMDIARDAASQKVVTTDLESGAVVGSGWASDADNVALGFLIPKATDAGPGVLDVGYDLRLDTSRLSNPVDPRPFDPDHPEKGTRLCRLVYTISLAP